MEPARRSFRVALALLVVFVSLAGIELMCRVKMFVSLNYNPAYLIAPFQFNGSAKAPTPSAGPAAAAAAPPRARLRYTLDVDHFSPDPGSSDAVKVLAASASAPPHPPHPPNTDFLSGAKDWQPLTTDGTYFKARPGSRASVEEGSHRSGQVTINSLGFRGKEFDPLNTHGKVRVFCVGGSATFGGFSDDDTYPARLEVHLNRPGGLRAEVINAGFIAYVSNQFLSLIRNELVTYQPDAIIVYAGFNDLNPFFNYHLRQQQPRWITWLHGKLYYRWSMFYTLLVEKISVMVKDSPNPISVTTMTSPQKIFLRNIEALAKLSEAHGFTLIVVRELLYSPEPVFVRDQVPLGELTQLLRATPHDSHGAPYIEPAILHRHNELMRSLQALCARRKIPMWDVREEFHRAMANQESLFYDWVHLTPSGNDLLA